jgi:hypothetical protein
MRACRAHSYGSDSVSSRRGFVYGKHRTRWRLKELAISTDKTSVSSVIATVCIAVFPVSLYWFILAHSGLFSRDRDETRPNAVIPHEE